MSELEQHLSYLNFDQERGEYLITDLQMELIPNDRWALFGDQIQTAAREKDLLLEIAPHVDGILISWKKNGESRAT